MTAASHSQSRTVAEALRAMEVDYRQRQFQGIDGAWYPFMNDKHYRDTDADPDEYWPIRTIYTIEQVEAAEGAARAVPVGYKLVLVPELQPEDEPDWAECIRQAEVATGLPARDPVLNIFIREVRRWLHGRAESKAPAASQQFPDCKIVDRGFRWDSAKQEHVPSLVLEFTPVPVNGPNDAKGWKDRDALAKLLSKPVASPEDVAAKVCEWERHILDNEFKASCNDRLALRTNRQTHCHFCGVRIVEDKP